MRARRVRRAIGGLLVAAGVSALSWSGFVLAKADYTQLVMARSLPTREEVVSPRAGQTLGLLEVPRLGLSSIVVEGDDPASLLVAAGHLPETPLPWQAGNSVLAAHRDTDFRPLEGIRQGDVVRFHTAEGAIEYVVRETRIVEPTEVSVLRPTEQSMLTLITCYPFTFIGSAPHRFIVRAERTTPGRAIL
jgi:sortase A